MKALFIIACMAIPAIGIAGEQAVHVHGTAQMDVVVDGKKVLLRLESPADNFLSFEHAPKSDYEKTKLKDATAQLQFAANMVALNADCKSSPPIITMPNFGMGEHSDIKVEYTFECSNQPTQIKLPMWQNFAAFKALSVNLATEQGQKQLTLKPGQVLDLK